MDWSEMTKLFAVGAFPWISEFKKLEIHFKYKDLKLSSIYNFFASLFAAGIYSYSYYIDAYQSTNLPPWYVFLILACTLTVLYFSFFIYQRDNIEKGKNMYFVIINFCLYILIFSSLTFGFALVKSFKDNVVISGKIYSSNGAHAKKSDIELMTSNQTIFTLNSDSLGKFTLFLDKKYLDSIQRISVVEELSGENYTANTFGSGAIFTFLSNIKLNKQSSKK